MHLPIFRNQSTPTLQQHSLLTHPQRDEIGEHGAYYMYVSNATSKVPHMLLTRTHEAGCHHVDKWVSELDNNVPHLAHSNRRNTESSPSRTKHKYSVFDLILLAVQQPLTKARERQSSLISRATRPHHHAEGNSEPPTSEITASALHMKHKNASHLEAQHQHQNVKWDPWTPSSILTPKRENPSPSSICSSSLSTHAHT